jgi:D-amino peptidase
VSAAKVYLSTDIEGTAGIVDWGQVIGPSAEYEVGRRLLLAEVNAAIDGAADAGASAFLVVLWTRVAWESVRGRRH